ncbi:MAG: dTDP-glucose 4,6-dehydratase [Candidatus Delongbacteria bacterium]|nr:dTDP-glucose 4,6-dehydratase [Candidatus Delongbacteria bacterium]
MKTILVTGGAGFIGSNFIRMLLAETTGYDILNADSLTYAGNLENLADITDDPRYSFIKADISDPVSMEAVFNLGPLWAVVNFAAESHVDRSIADPGVFVRTNVLGTQLVLDLSRRYGVERFQQVSTDEVYGSLGATGRFTEETPLAPNSPYAASKAAADLLCRAAYKTFQQPVLVTRCSNNYGPWQFPEKLIPLMIANALEDKPLPVYGQGENVRDWLQVEDHCRAILQVLEQGEPGRIYNVGGDNEWRNIDIVRLILHELDKPESLIRFVKDRPGHDQRYAIDSTRLQEELGWRPRQDFTSGIRATITWYRKQVAWLAHMRDGSYRDYYEHQYGKV